MGSETLPSACYILSNESSNPFNSTCNGYQNVRKALKRLQEVRTDEKGRLIQAVAHYCGISPTRSNTTTGKIGRIVEVLEEIH